MSDVFVYANVVFAIATLPLIRQVLKNRNNLNDFDLRGSILTTTALLLMAGGYGQLKMFTSLAFMAPTLFYWAFISICGTKSYVDKRFKSSDS